MLHFRYVRGLPLLLFLDILWLRIYDDHCDLTCRCGHNGDQVRQSSLVQAYPFSSQTVPLCAALFIKEKYMSSMKGLLRPSFPGVPLSATVGACRKDSLQ